MAEGQGLRGRIDTGEPLGFHLVRGTESQWRSWTCNPRRRRHTILSVKGSHGQNTHRLGHTRCSFVAPMHAKIARQTAKAAQRGTDAALDIQSVLSDFLGDMCDIFQAREKGASKKTA